MPTFDFVFSALALAFSLSVLAWLRKARRWRLAAALFALASQIAPMTWREPLLLVPLLGALIPVAVILWALVALSRKRMPA